MKNSLVKRAVTLFVVILVLFSACENGVDLVEDGVTPSGTKLSTNLSGIVLNENGEPASGVLVSVDGNTTMTNAFGIYFFEDVKVSKDRFVVTGRRTGYFDAVKAVTFIKGSNCHYANLNLMAKSLAGNFQSASGGTITFSNGSSISFPPGSIVDASGNLYSGNVNVYAVHINEDTPDFLSKIPGGDLRAKDVSGQDKILQTYGMMKTELVGSGGQKLNLAPQKKATINFAIASTQLSSATATIPLWYFDESKAMWMEEGTATKNGNKFQGDVAHFTWWNCDYPVQMCNIQGIVKDCLGVPLGNLTIQFNGMYTLTTNSQGQYQAMWPYTIPISAQVLMSMNPGLNANSNIIQAGPFSMNSTNVLPDLIVPCTTSKIKGALKDCNGNPVSGFVMITGTQMPVVSYCTNGIIDMTVLPSLPINILAYVRNFTGATSTISASPGQTLNIGNLNVCDVDQQSNIIINGDGYSNQHFEIDTTSTNTIFSPSGPSTGLIISGYTIPSNKQCLIQIDFCSAGAGMFPLGPTPVCNSDISMILDGVAYYPDDANSSDDFISVMEYGSTNEIIKGTFFTHLARVDTTSGNIPITMSGTFMVPRRH
ncbi:MAG TPA: hypothetical protein PKD91_15275 [Bacteroidia bacterium]|nr:hypothetical protein [Bacteroidia bacterium]